MSEAVNYNTSGKGTPDGEIKFGHIHDDNNISATFIRSGHDAEHYVALDCTGTKERQHGTICRSPGSFQVFAGKNVPPKSAGVFIDAQSGDLVLQALSGRIRIHAQNIDLIAQGSGGENGVITIDGSEKVILISQIVDISAKTSTKIVSSGTVDVIGKTILNIYGGLIDAADGSTSTKGSKGGPSMNEEKNK